MKIKVILITGALTGIGRATALAFAREGAHVAVCGRHDDAGNALVTELRAVGVEAEYIRADVRLEDDVRSLGRKGVSPTLFNYLQIASFPGTLCAWLASCAWNIRVPSITSSTAETAARPSSPMMRTASDSLTASARLAPRRSGRSAAFALEPVWKLRGALRRGVLAV